MKKLVAKNALFYATRHLRAGDEFEASRRDAGILVAVGVARYATKPQRDDIAALRAEYLRKVGKRPFHGWGAAELRRRMAEAA